MLLAEKIIDGEIDMKKSSIQVKFCFDPGYGKSVFDKSKENIRAAFKEVLPQSHEIKTAHFTLVESTTLQIIISGISIGAGIVAAEMLKECGKDLWKVVKRQLLPEKKNTETEPQRSHDKLSLILRIGDSEMKATLSGHALQSETAIRKFFKRDLIKLYETYSAHSKSKGE